MKYKTLRGAFRRIEKAITKRKGKPESERRLFEEELIVGGLKSEEMVN